jgi:hypothetical protein
MELDRGVPEFSAWRLPCSCACPALIDGRRADHRH